MHGRSWFLYVSVLAALAVVAAALGTTESPRPTSRAGHFAVTTTTAPSVTTTAPASTNTTTTTPSVTASVVTLVLTYDPYSVTGTVAPTVVVSSRANAHCVNGGVAGHSYRCFVAPSGGISDPCFAAPGTTTGPLLCPVGVPGTDVTELTVSTLPPLTTVGRVQSPWAVELSNGQVCEKVNAAWGGLGPYGCQTPGPAADCRTPVKATPTWSDACQAQLTTTSPFVTYPVEKVWF